MRIYLILFLLFCIPFSLQAQTLERSVDIVVEPQTTVPAFYQGRPEPTPGSTVRAIAVIDGVSNPDTYTYRWEVGGFMPANNELGTTSSITFTTPLGGEFLLRVDLFDASGVLVASEQRYVPVSEPIVRFYQASLLRGVSPQALPNEFIMLEDEISVRAEPYFMGRGLHSDTYELTWSVGGREIKTGNGDDYILTLRKNEGSGRANIGFRLRNQESFGQSIKDGFQVSF